MKKEYSQQAKIILGFECNNNCLFCFEKTKRHLPGKTTIELKQEILAIKKLGFCGIHFIGGEPTIRKDIVELVAFAKNHGFEDIMITTNGRMFVYPWFVREVVAAGLNQIVFSIHGHNPEIHDKLVSAKGAFFQLKKGIENVRNLNKKGVLFSNIGVNVVIVEDNYKYLPDIGRMLLKWKIERVEFVYVSAIGGLPKEFVPKVSLAYSYILETIKLAREYNYPWIVDNVPVFCYFFEIKDNIYCAENESGSLFVKSNKSKTFYKLGKNKVLNWGHVEKCDQCRLKSKCIGVQDVYFKQFGDKEIVPLLKN